MKRRDLSLGLAGAATLAALGARGAAAAGPRRLVEGQDYATLETPVAMQATGGIEVVEFFWYGCPHCFHFEPELQRWAAKAPADVRLRRVAYGFDEALRELHQQVFVTWEVLGLVEAMHAKTFDRFHRQRKPVDSLADMLQFAAESGLDVAKVKEAWNGFAVSTRLAQARRLCEAWGVDFVPQLGIQGRFLTAPSMAGDGTRALAAADTLIALVRKGA